MCCNSEHDLVHFILHELNFELAFAKCELDKHFSLHLPGLLDFCLGESEYQILHCWIFLKKMEPRPCKWWTRNILSKFTRGTHTDAMNINHLWLYACVTCRLSWTFGTAFPLDGEWTFNLIELHWKWIVYFFKGQSSHSKYKNQSIIGKNKFSLFLFDNNIYI